MWRTQLKTLFFASAVALAIFGSTTAAQAGIVFDTSLVDGVHYGSGNFNTHFATDTVTTANGAIEIGLKTKIRSDATDSTVPTGDLYSIALGNLANFDFSVDNKVGATAVDLSGSTASLRLLNENNGLSFSFNPFTFLPDNTVLPGGGIQNSEQYKFFAPGFNVTTNATYLATLTLANVSGFGTLSVDNVLRYGNGGIIAGVPEPSTWAMMLVGFGGIGAVIRRRRVVFA